MTEEMMKKALAEMNRQNEDVMVQSFMDVRNTLYILRNNIIDEIIEHEINEEHNDEKLERLIKQSEMISESICTLSVSIKKLTDMIVKKQKNEG